MKERRKGSELQRDQDGNIKRSERDIGKTHTEEQRQKRKGKKKKAEIEMGEGERDRE